MLGTGCGISVVRGYDFNSNLAFFVIDGILRPILMLYHSYKLLPCEMELALSSLLKLVFNYILDSANYVVVKHIEEVCLVNGFMKGCFIM